MKNRKLALNSIICKRLLLFIAVLLCTHTGMAQVLLLENICYEYNAPIGFTTKNDNFGYPENTSIVYPFFHYSMSFESEEQDFMMVIEDYYAYFGRKRGYNYFARIRGHCTYSRLARTKNIPKEEFDYTERNLHKYVKYMPKKYAKKVYNADTIVVYEVKFSELYKGYEGFVCRTLVKTDIMHIFQYLLYKPGKKNSTIRKYKDVIENTIAFTDISREECEKSLIPTQEELRRTAEIFDSINKANRHLLIEL